MSRLWNFVRGAEPALVVGAVVAGMVAVQEALQNGSVVSWHVLVPVFVAAVIRQLVVPTKRAEAQVEAAEVKAQVEHEVFVSDLNMLARHQQEGEPPGGY